MERDSFVFYRSFADALADLDGETRLHCYDAIARYALDGEETELSGVESAVFKLIKPQIDANNRRFENGLKGGRPKHNQTITKLKPNNNQTKTKVEPNVNVNDNVNDNVNVNVKSIGKTQAFIPPSLGEVQDYCFERNNNVDAQHFIDFYTSKGWMIGKTKMKDWRAAVRTWERRDVQEFTNNKQEVDDFFKRELGGI